MDKNTQEYSETLNFLFNNNLKMENSILKIIIENLLLKCPGATYESCYNEAILQLVKTNRKEDKNDKWNRKRVYGDNNYSR